MSKQITGVEASRLFHASKERSAQTQPAVFSLKKARIARLCGEVQKDLSEALEAVEGFKDYITKRSEIIGDKAVNSFVFLLGGFYPVPGFSTLDDKQIEELFTLDEENKAFSEKAVELGKQLFDLDLPVLTATDFNGVTLTQEAAAAFEMLSDI
jgi:hypothetical protein